MATTLRRSSVVACALVLCLGPFAARAEGEAAPAPTAAAAPAAPPPAAAPTTVITKADGDRSAEASTADEAFELKTKALEEQVNDLKEKIYRTKYRLQTLAESVLEGSVNTGAKLAIWHRNELGSSYVLTSAAYTLDGAPLYTKVDETGDLNEREEFVVFDQRSVPGQHQISVQYQLRGHGYGIFAYLEGMRLKLTSAYSFNVEPGKITKITSILREKDGITLQFDQKPDIRFEMSVQKDVGRPSDGKDESTPQVSAGGGDSQ